MINQFIIEDVRCFADKQELEIRPLTLLVGENSTGKSTVLGCYQGISRSPWHDRPVVKPQKTNMISALYWTHKEEITLVASVEADAVWLIRIIKGDN